MDVDGINDQPGIEHTDTDSEDTESAFVPTVAKTNASLVDVIKGELKELQQSKEIYIAVVGYEKSGLHARYVMPENGRILDDIARNVMRQFKDNYSRNLYGAIDTMARLCEGLYVQTPETGDEYVELDPDELGYPVKYDIRLGELINSNGSAPLDSARKVIRALFGDKEILILNHSAKLNRWLMNTNADVESELWATLGE